MRQASEVGRLQAGLRGDWETDRRSVEMPGITIESVSSRSREPFTFGFTGQCGLLSLNERGYRSDGETNVAGLVPSRRRSLGGVLVFVPPGASLSGWSVPSIRSTWLNVYLGPSLRSLDGQLQLGDLGLEPRIHFVDPAVRITMEKLKPLLDADGEEDGLYAELLCAVLVAELQRCMRRPAVAEPQRRHLGASGGDRSGTGSLSGFRERKLREYIEERLAEPLTLAELAEQVGLSPLHLVRTFKNTTGMPPHRYIVLRRVERAKRLLSHHGNSVTDVALATGFGSSSHFCHAFRRVTGLSPTAFRKTLGA